MAGYKFVISNTGAFISGNKAIKKIYDTANKIPYNTWDGPLDYRVVHRMTEGFTIGKILKYKPVKLNEKVVY